MKTTRSIEQGAKTHKTTHSTRLQTVRSSQFMKRILQNYLILPMKEKRKCRLTIQTHYVALSTKVNQKLVG